MAKVTIQCEYPFWLPGQFLFHTQDRKSRLKIFQAWAKTLNDKNESNKIPQIDLRNHPGNKISCHSQIANDFLKQFTWGIEGFDEDPHNKVEDKRERIFPSNLRTQKGGVLIGKSKAYPLEEEITREAKRQSEKEGQESDFDKKHENGETKTTNQKENHHSEFASKLHARFRSKTGNIVAINSLTCASISFRIGFYDWSLGYLTIEYELDEIKYINQDQIDGLGKLAGELQECFMKGRFEGDSDIPPLGFLRQIKDVIDLEEEKERVEGNEEKAGHEGYDLINPNYSFFEYLIRGFALTIPDDEVAWRSYFGTNGKIENFFDIQLELIPKKKKAPLAPTQAYSLNLFRDTVRLPFIVHNFIFKTEDFEDGQSLADLDLSPLVDDEAVPEGHKKTQKIFRKGNVAAVATGFKGNVIILSRKEEETSEEKLTYECEITKLQTRIEWVWRLGLIYFSALHKMQSHLVTRKGLHIEAVQLIEYGHESQFPFRNHSLDNNSPLSDNRKAGYWSKKFEYKFSPGTVEKEIQRLELMQIAIEIVLQEASLVYVGDNFLNRLIYTDIRTIYNFDQLESSLKRQIPVLKEDLDSDNRKQNAKNLQSLSYLTFLGATISVFLLMLTLVEKTFIGDWIYKGFLPSFSWYDLGETWRIFFNYIFVLFIPLMIVIITYYLGRAIFSQDPYFKAIGDSLFFPKSILWFETQNKGKKRPQG